MKLYLITGFLGAGKTTFLKRFVRLFAGERIFLLINEFGRVGVDGELLREMNAALAEISDGSIFCACRLDRFEQTLQEALSQAPDVMLVEASGLADPTSIRRLLANPRYAGIDYQGGVCLVDAARFAAVRETARVCSRQVAVSSLALLNKCDAATPAQIAEAEKALLEINPAIVVRKTSFGAFETAWLRDIVPRVDMDAAMETAADITLQKACLTLAEMPEARLGALLDLLAGDTYRIKGFVESEGRIYLVDCVGPLVELHPYAGARPAAVNRLVLLAGRGMPLRKAVKHARALYAEFIREVEW